MFDRREGVRQPVVVQRVAGQERVSRRYVPLADLADTAMAQTKSAMK